MKEKDNEGEITNYTKEIEDIFISFMMSNPDLLIRCKGILKSEYFDNRQNRESIAFIENYSTDFTNIPSTDILYAATQKEIKIDVEQAVEHEGWFLREFELFCRYKALKNAILSSPTLLDEGQVPTGWTDVDYKLFGGLNKGEITIFAGQSGAGKSLFLQNLAVNWIFAGLNVVYLSLELSEALCTQRIDAMVTGYETKEVMRNIDDVHMKIRANQQKYKGNLQVKQLPNGCTANDVRAFIKEYQITKGVKVDAILVDYLDLMMPMSKKISAENLFVKDKYVSEELRNLAVELGSVMVSASQLNRGSYEEIEFDPSHIAGGISKVNTADNVVGIFTSIAMREGGRYQIQFMKTRSSAGVGSKVDLSFNNKSLRIADLEEGQDDAVTASSKSIYETLKKKSVIKSNEKIDSATGEISKIVENNRVDPIEGASALRNFLKKRNS